MTPEVFNCPSCSAPLQPNGAAATVQCPYCGESVVVPPGLRTPAPRPTVVVEFPASTYHPTPATPATPVATSGSGGCIVQFCLQFAEQRRQLWHTLCLAA